MRQLPREISKPIAWKNSLSRKKILPSPTHLDMLWTEKCCLRNTFHAKAILHICLNHSSFDYRQIQRIYNGKQSLLFLLISFSTRKQWKFLLPFNNKTLRSILHSLGILVKLSIPFVKFLRNLQHCRVDCTVTWLFLHISVSNVDWASCCIRCFFGLLQLLHVFRFRSWHLW